MSRISVEVDIEEIIDQVSAGDMRRLLRKLRPADLVEICRVAGLTVIGSATPDEIEIWRDLSSEIRDTARAGDLRHLEVLLLRMEVLVGVPKQRLTISEKAGAG